MVYFLRMYRIEQVFSFYKEELRYQIDYAKRLQEIEESDSGSDSVVKNNKKKQSKVSEDDFFEARLKANTITDMSTDEKA